MSHHPVLDGVTVGGVTLRGYLKNGARYWKDLASRLRADSPQNEGSASCFEDKAFLLESVMMLLETDARIPDAPANASASAVLQEFLKDSRVCLAISADCVGNHQEDPCRCLYCRARKALSE